MRVMYVASNPEGLGDLKIQGEVNDLQERLERGAGADPIEFRVFTDLKLSELTGAIARVRPDVLHFAAHGDGQALLLAHPTDGSVQLDGFSLSAMLKALAVRPRLVVLNACSSHAIASDLAATGAADWVIGTDETITNDAARALTAALYQRLADGSSIGDAFVIATTHVEAVDRGAVGATLHPAGRIDEARRVRLVDPLRILAYMPVIEAWLDEGLEKPVGRFRHESPLVQFGVGGAPAAARQMVFFTDDETVRAKKGKSLADARSWLVETQPINAEIWLDDAYEYYGDMAWYVAVTTTDRRVVSAASTTIQALERYYFEERWRGELPPLIAQIVNRTVASLRHEAGSRRGRETFPRAASKL